MAELAMAELERSASPGFRRQVLGRAMLGAAALVGSCLWLLGGAGCAEKPPGPPVIDGPFNPPGDGGVAVEQLCPKSTKCGDACTCAGGCCPEDETCVAGGTRCWKPQVSCQTSADCTGSDTFCSNGFCLFYASTSPSQENKSCREQANLATLVPEIKCQWPGPTPPEVQPNSVQVVGTPMVIDFNFDDDKTSSHPSIVFVSYEAPYVNNRNGILRIIDGKTCELQHTIAPPNLPIPPDASPALANLDEPTCPRPCPDEKGDSRPEIVFPAVDYSGASPRAHILAYRLDPDTRDFIQWWDSETTTSVANLFSISIHDLDGDGDPEVLTADQVLDPNGSAAPGEVLVAIPFEGGRGLVEPPVVTDVNGDKSPEIVTSQGIYEWNPTTERPVLAEYWPANATPVTSAFTAVADLTTEGFVGIPGSVPEMVVVDADKAISVMSIAGQVLQKTNLEGASGGPPTIADFDGDGKMEYASAGSNHFTVFDLDCRADKFVAANCKPARQGNSNAILWSTLLPYSSSGTSGSSVFDFDSNGSAEVVYADECYMRMFDGKTGAVLHSVPRSSRTGWEYPVVADVDGDGHADIVAGTNDNNPGFTCPPQDNLKPETKVSMTHGVTVWENEGWAGARPIWNQYDYYVTHVDETGQIPNGRSAKRHWMVDDPLTPGTNEGEGTNTFRENTAGTGANSFSFDQADLTTVALPGFECKRLENGSFTADISIQVCNRGLVPIAAQTAEVSLLPAGSASTTMPISVTVAAALPPGVCETVPGKVPVAANQTLEIQVVGDPAKRITECIEGNNGSQVVQVRCNTVPD